MAFNLNTAIKSWISTFTRHRAFSRDDIEELERHIRDHVDYLEESGISEEDAFRTAIIRVGDYGSVEGEYRKVFWDKLRFHGGWKREIIWELSMFKNYMQVAFRNLARYKGYTFINIFGLALGTACVILISLFVRDELSFDRHNKDADRIVRIHVGERQVVTPTILSPLFQREIPDVETGVRIYPLGMYRNMVVAADDRVFEESGFFFADSSVFDVFTFRVVAGVADGALVRPNTVVITESMARKYFGQQNPIGRVLTVDSNRDYEVTAVIEDLVATSHLQFDFLGSFVSTSWADRELWNTANFFTYLKIRPGATTESLQAGIDAVLDARRSTGDSAFSENYSLTVHPLLDIRLHFEGRDKYVMLFGAIAILILLVACANYTNLATARSARRSREVGIRKVAGANRAQLARQFFGESAVMSVIAMLLAAGMATWALPALNNLSGKSISADFLTEPGVLLGLFALAAFISLVAGGYPALMLSAFSPAEVLKGSRGQGGGGFTFRKILVVFQFAVTVFLLTGTFVIFRQLQFMQSKDLGFDKEHVVVLSIGDRELRQDYQRLKDAFISSVGIQQVSAVHSVPGFQRSEYGMIGEGLEFVEGEDQAMLVNGIPVDRDVAEVLDLTFLAGDGFTKSDGYVPEDGNYQYIVNESLIRAAGWEPENAIGRRIELMSNRQGQIVGVYKNYHYASLHDEILPQALFIEPSQFSKLMIRVQPGNTARTLETIEEVWKREAPGRPFVYKFLDTEFDALYRADQQTASLVGIFTLLAVFIACLGLVGLASFAAERRTKEIGVRKAIGASVPQILLLLSKEFALLVGIAFVIAAPIGYYALGKWLQSFAFRIDLSIWIFAAAGLATIVAAMATVLYQSLKAARIDPATSLRMD